MKILITGASSGIGRDMARTLSKQGNNLVLVARDEEKLKEVKDELETNGSNVEAISMDLSDEENCKDLHRKVKDVDILINNARIWGLWRLYKNRLRKRTEYDKNKYNSISYFNKIILKRYERKK